MKVCRIFWSTDIYVSTSPHDGTSVSLLEAMATGTFPIVTDIPANREWIVTGQNGFLVPIDEERCLAEKIVEAIRSKDLREMSRDRNLRLIKEKATWSAVVAEIKEIYKIASDWRGYSSGRGEARPDQF